MRRLQLEKTLNVDRASLDALLHPKLVFRRVGKFMNHSMLTHPEYRVIRSLARAFHSSWSRELMTVQRMKELQQKGMVTRDDGRWKLTALGLICASTLL